MNLLFGAGILLAAIAVFSLSFHVFRRPRLAVWRGAETAVTAVAILLTAALAFGLGNLAVAATDPVAQVGAIGSAGLAALVAATLALVFAAARLIATGRIHAARGGAGTPPPAANHDRPPLDRAA